MESMEIKPSTELMDQLGKEGGLYDQVSQELAPVKKPLDYLLRKSKEETEIDIILRREKQKPEDEQSQRDKRVRLRELLQVIGAAFMAATNLGDDQKLDFNEFRQQIPEHTRANHDEEEMRETFDLIDSDGSGCVSRGEFFFWSLRWMVHSGEVAGLERNFSRFDTTNDGELNRREWALAVERFGYGELGDEVFDELDADETNTVSYVELIDTLSRCPTQMSFNCQRLITAMAFDRSEMANASDTDKRMVALDKTAWHAQSVDELRETVRDRMFDELAKPSDVWDVMLRATGQERRLTVAQFGDAMKAVLGFERSTAWEYEVCEGAYDEMDDDSTGDITFDEFLNWMNTRQQRRRRAKHLNLRCRPRGAKPLRQIVWTPSMLRSEIHEMLMHGEVAVLDLLMAHDTSNDGQLDADEFLRMMRILVADDTSWHENGAMDASLKIFRLAAGSDASLDIEELESWLLKGTVEYPAPASKPKGTRRADRTPSRKLPKSGSLPALAPSAAASRRQPISGSKARLHASSSGTKVGGTASQLPPASPTAARGLGCKAEVPLGMTEETSAEGIISGRGLAERWLLRNSTVDGVLDVRRRHQLRYVPGARQEVVPAKFSVLGTPQRVSVDYD